MVWHAGYVRASIRQRVLAYWRGSVSGRLWRRHTGSVSFPGVPALVYHNVGLQQSDPRRPELTISPQQFERQLRWLAWQGYVGLTVSDLSLARSGNRTLPRKPILITFDDGYADIAEHALPLLHKMGFGATVFIVTELVGSASFWDGRRLMTAPQIRKWAAKGVEFGSHTCTHPDLTQVGGVTLRREIAESARQLAAITNTRPAAFAYPYGRHSGEVRECVRQTYDVGLTCDVGVNEPDTDPYLLRRVAAEPSWMVIDLARLVLGKPVILNQFRNRTRIRSHYTKVASTFRRIATAMSRPCDATSDLPFGLEKAGPRKVLEPRKFGGPSSAVEPIACTATSSTFAQPEITRLPKARRGRQ
jgi:peptidoglycan/xylan/chitin deacetylase (PgdA/CDA1 family)